MNPTITCLMVTRDRPAMAKRSIDCYVRQDYTFRTLNIVCDGTEHHDELSAYVRELGRSDIAVASVERNAHSLGALRNISVATAQGDVVCQWDDDDLYHPGRLRTQLASMKRHHAAACFMSDQLQLVMRTRALYWCDWSRPRHRPQWPPLIPNTLMCVRTVMPVYPESGELSRRSEDLYVMQQLSRSQRTAVLSGAGVLYIYITHGANTWPDAHHMGVASVTALDMEQLHSRRALLNDALKEYELSERITVRDCHHNDAWIVEAGAGRRLSSHGSK